MNDFPRQMTQPSGTPLVLDPTRLMLQFKQPVERNNLLRLLSEIGLQLEEDASFDPQTQRPAQAEIVNHSTQRFFVQSRLPITQERFQYIQTSAVIFGLDFIGPVYRVAGQVGRRALVTPLPNVLVVRLRQQTGTQQAPELNLPPILAAATFPANAAPRIQENTAKSQYLAGFRYYTIQNPEDVNAYQLRAILEGDITRQVVDVQFENVPLIKPYAAVPNDALFTQQWDMVRIGAAGSGTTGWDISIGDATVVVAVIDDGVERNHPDLAFAPGPGFNASTLVPDGAATGPHGTAVAGIVGALFNNALGIAGVAGGSRILPIAVQNFSDIDLAIGINFARMNAADVILISLASPVWENTAINAAINAAFAANIVIVAATGNTNSAITYPATHPQVIAVGASDELDRRLDMPLIGSNYGAQISVVAPGINIPTTDRLGTAGYNATAGAPGDFFVGFGGTSAAAAHVAGLAALLKAIYPALSNVQIRSLIERSAEKVGSVAYQSDVNHPAGTWNQQMGYGRINVFRALDTADLLIRDAATDTGNEPFINPVFYRSPDIWINTIDNGNLPLGTNTVYVRVTNAGPRAARNVKVSVRVTGYVALQFVYPEDWTLVDASHIAPAPVLNTFAVIPAGTSVIASFTLSEADTRRIYGVGPTGIPTGARWHPCVLAVVEADNDYPFTTSPLTADPIVARLNNLAQRNVTLNSIVPLRPAILPFIAGSRFNPEREMTLVIDRSQVPQGTEVLLSLDDEGSAFPLVDFVPPQRDPDDVVEEEGCGASALVFLEPTRIQTRLGCASGIMTLARGSRFDCAPVTTPGQVQVTGGEVIVRGGRRFVNLVAAQVIVRLQKAPNQIYPMALHTTLPANAALGQQFVIDIAQRNTQGVTVGGATVVYQVGETQQA